MYHFHQDDEGLAWRIAGLAARQCMELGLHRRETYQALFSDEASRVSAVKLFWSIYVLDRRWSFGTGMPFALQDADIDPQLPKPVSLIPPADPFELWAWMYACKRRCNEDFSRMSRHPILAL